MPQHIVNVISFFSASDCRKERHLRSLRGATQSFNNEKTKSKSGKKMMMYYQNVRGLRTKTSEFYSNMMSSSYDFVALTETFLNSSVYDSELFTSDYTVLRKDRHGDVGWGGVLLAVKSCYEVKEVTNIDDLTEDKELIFAIVTRKNIKLFIIVVYLPPSCNSKQYLSVLTCIENAIGTYPDYDFLIVGDFNLKSCNNSVKMQFDVFLDYCKLRQCNNVHNKFGCILDFVLTNISIQNVNVISDAEPLVPVDAYHPPLVIFISLLPLKQTLAKPVSKSRVHSPNTEWNFRKADFQRLYSHIAGSDWSEVLQERDIDAAVDIFYNKLNNVINEHVPLKKNNLNNKYVYPVWYTGEIIHYIKLKHYNLKMFKIHNLLYNRELFKYYRSRVKALINAAYKKYISTVENNITTNPSSFWQYVKDKRTKRQQGREFVYNNQVVVGQDAVDAFAQYFGSVFHDRVPSLNPEAAERDAMDCGTTSRIIINNINAVDLRRAVRRLKTSSAFGPDNIPAFLIKDCLTSFETPLLHLYNLSLQSCVYPNRWKVSRVTPVPKTGSSMEVTSFRPIAVLSVVAKLFESIVNHSLTNQLSGLLSDSQHGFRRARSTLTNHINFVDYASNKMIAGGQVDAAYFDFSKAFDLVDNDILLTKFASFGFSSQLLRFMADYLRDRKQYVRMGVFRSQEYYTRSGVSQGSTLGPTQFLIMINDLPRVLMGTECLMFADDLKLFHSISDISDCEQLQSDIDAVVRWSKRNKLTFNVTKCKSITFTRSRSPVIMSYELAGTPIERVATIRDLGVTLDCKLNFHEHIIKTSKEASKALGFIIRTSSNFNNLKTIKLLYNAYVRSKLEYNSIIWNPQEKLYTLMIEKIQRKFARFIYKRQYGYYPYLYPSLFVSGMVDLDTLELRRKFVHIFHYYCLITERMDNPSVRENIHFYVPDRYLRGTGRRRHRLLACPPSWRSPQTDNCPTGRAINLINRLLQCNPDADLFFNSVGTVSKYILFYLNISK